MEKQLKIYPGTREVVAAVLAVLALVASVGATAREVTVLAPVVDVEPVYGAPERRCDVPPPERNDGLAAQLAWDLRDRCRAVATATRTPDSYRVVYEWDGRRFATLTDEPPGETVQLFLDID